MLSKTNNISITRAVTSKIHQRIHHAIEFILAVAPSGLNSLMPVLKEEFPHKAQSLFSHVTYLRNLLCVTDYTPELRNQVLELVIDRIIQVDVRHFHCLFLGIIYFAY